MSLKLLDAISRETTGFAATPYISQNEKQAFFDYAINVTPESDVIAERFDLVNGQFFSRAVLHGDLQFPSSDSGVASDNFRFFSVADDNQSTDSPKGRLRIFDRDLNVPISERIFTDPFLFGFTFFGGAFAPDNRYTQINYVTKDTRPTQTSTLKVLRTTDLTTAAEIEFIGVIEAAPRFFIRNRKLYLAAVVSQGVLDFNQDPATTELPPYQLRIYQVNFRQKTLDLVASAILPQGVANLHLTCSQIYLGTRQALVEKDETIFEQTEANTSATPDNREFRIYSFSGKRLELVEAHNFDYTIEDIALLRQKAIFNLVGVTGLPGFFQLTRHFDIRKYNQGTYTNPVFNVVMTDSLVLVGTSSSKNVKNLQLYKIRK